MAAESFDLADLARYLQRDARDLEKLASRGRLPGRRVAEQWRFNRDEINQWLEQELSDLTDTQLENVEVGVRGGPNQSGELKLLVSRLVSVDTIAVPLEARTAPRVLERLVETANGAWQVYDPEKVLTAVRAREQLHTTALPGGVAIPHPRRPLPDAIGESLIAFGRTASGIAFGGARGSLTDLFFLVLCQSERTHLQVLARLSRMFQREPFFEQLRQATDAAQTLDIIRTMEEEVLA